VNIGFGLVSWVEDGSCAGRSEMAVRHLTLKVNKNKIKENNFFPFYMIILYHAGRIIIIRVICIIY
jgi:hypothetical protein